MGPKCIEIVTDSTCDIPQVLIEQYEIVVQPHVVIWGEQQYRDRVDLQPDEFYRRLRTDHRLPTTSQASVQDFATVYERARERGAEAVVAIVVSSALSGAFQSATKASEEAGIPVYVHNSRGVTMSLGWQVLAAARAREAGGDIADILAAAERVRRCVELYICLDTLEYVYRGGRIGNASRLVGAMLNIKPLIYINHESGIVEAGSMAMTRRRGLEMLYNKFFSLVNPSRPMHIAVLHGDAAEDAAVMVERVRREYHPRELLTNITGPALGINTGPLAIALCGYNDPD
jgi:fatty acid kinase fatty acid binding subunit